MCRLTRQLVVLDRFGSVWTGQAKRWRPSLEYVYCCMVNRSLTIEMVLDKKKLTKKESQNEEFPCGNCF